MSTDLRHASVLVICVCCEFTDICVHLIPACLIAFACALQAAFLATGSASIRKLTRYTGSISRTVIVWLFDRRLYCFVHDFGAGQQLHHGEVAKNRRTPSQASLLP